MKARVGERKMFCPLVHFSDGNKRQSWNSLKSGIQSFTKVSHMRSRVPNTAFSKATGRGWIRNGAADTRIRAHMDAGSSVWQLYPLCLYATMP